MVLKFNEALGTSFLLERLAVANVKTARPSTCALVLKIIDVAHRETRTYFCGTKLLFGYCQRMPIKRECEYDDCPVEAALDLIGGKWKAMVIALLMDKTMRFNELQRALKTVTHRVLAAQLKDLEECGIVHRELFPEVPPRVEYSLTQLGRTLRPLIDELRNWGTEYALTRRAK